MILRTKNGDVENFTSKWAMRYQRQFITMTYDLYISLTCVQKARHVATVDRNVQRRHTASAVGWKRVKTPDDNFLHSLTC